MEQELSSTAQIAAELEHKSKNPNRDVLNIAKRLGLTAVATRPREGKNHGGKPEMLWSKEQKDAILADNRNRHKEPAQIDSPVDEPHDVSETSPADETPDQPDVTAKHADCVSKSQTIKVKCVKSNPPESQTIEVKCVKSNPPPALAKTTFFLDVKPAPVVDTEALIAEPLDNKSLEELADEANLYKKRGDDCMKLGLTFYFEAGRRLIEAKKRVGHGNWQNWLAQNFSASDDTATNYMKLARRFGESNSETFRNLNPATVIKLLALPEGEEERFIKEQAAAGKPIETQSARDVQKHVKEFKQRQAAKKDSDNTEPVDELQHVRADVDAEGIEAREVVAEPMPAAVSLPAQINEPDEDTNVVTTPAQVTAIIRKLIGETDDDQQLNSLKIALTDAIILLDAKRAMLAQKN